MAGSPRLDYSALPLEFRQSIDAAVGARVVSATNAKGGFTPGPAATCVLDDGHTVFIKARSSELSFLATAMHQREAAVLAELPVTFPAPNLLATVEAGDWFALITEHIDGAMPTAPFSATEVDGILQTVADLADASAVCPIEIADPVGTHEIERESRWAWRQLRDEGLRDERQPGSRWVTDHLRQLVELEANWIDAASGAALLHRDLRADNILLVSDGGVAVDWAAASTGAPWIDLLGLLPDLHLGGGPDPHVAFADHPIGAAAPSNDVDCYLASLAGYFTRQSLQPPIPGVSGIREFQAAQGEISRRWLASRLGWVSEG